MFSSSIPSVAGSARRLALGVTVAGAVIGAAANPSYASPPTADSFAPVASCARHSSSFGALPQYTEMRAEHDVAPPAMTFPNGDVDVAISMQPVPLVPQHGGLDLLVPRIDLGNQISYTFNGNIVHDSNRHYFQACADGQSHQFRPDVVAQGRAVGLAPVTALAQPTPQGVDMTLNQNQGDIHVLQTPHGVHVSGLKGPNGSGGEINVERHGNTIELDGLYHEHYSIQLLSDGHSLIKSPNGNLLTETGVYMNFTRADAAGQPTPVSYSESSGLFPNWVP